MTTMGVTGARAALPTAQKDYRDYYWMMTYAEFLQRQADGTLDQRHELTYHEVFTDVAEEVVAEAEAVKDMAATGNWPNPT